MVEVRHLCKRYGSFTVVHDLSFALEKGKCYGLLGPNGAGKSTTMNMVTGYLAPTAGEIKIGGYDMLEEPEKAKRFIGYLPEIPPLYTEMTVREYLACVAGMKGIPRSRMREETDACMEKVLIADRAGSLIRNLSKGYKQRVGIAQALSGRPAGHHP